MKLVRFGLVGQEKPGLIDNEGRVRDLSAIIPDLAGEHLSADTMGKLASLDTNTLPLVEGTPQQDLRLGACVNKVGKFICIGLNYADHAAESGMPVPAEPVIFSKWTSAIVGPNDDVKIPKGSEKTDWEVELGVIIGEGGSDIDEADAMKHVAGFCVINDVSERAFQLEGTGTWDKGKGCDTFGPTGPWLVTPDEVGDSNDLGIWLEIDGKRYQNGSTSTMVFKVPHLIAYCSRFMSLQPGDIISTGTPPGVGLGLNPPLYLKGGEEMKLGIDKLGVQCQKVVKA
ncbi:fumarylacetoacetate hydrolase family protein [Marinomonas transparens]|uniref:Fumarylacetoacetate hydrolase family protein n=1 Tax=Marinomonas transparens TaxID=2795388 RepID=A0A934JRJ3_9GAMM|nr:fumarylacetoacetate hydrolase family protein [Marinomonas transparens]MBJ7539383.1 fumarylacetoacetate hydrolase family protein [Marinomonas transparens]